nr:hypothetical protein Iba_chr01cCG7070 [Ipomoea batatas]
MFGRLGTLSGGNLVLLEGLLLIGIIVGLLAEAGGAGLTPEFLDLDCDLLVLETCGDGATLLWLASTITGDLPLPRLSIKGIPPWTFGPYILISQFVVISTLCPSIFPSNQHPGTEFPNRLNSQHSVDCRVKIPDTPTSGSDIVIMSGSDKRDGRIDKGF